MSNFVENKRKFTNRAGKPTFQNNILERFLVKGPSRIFLILKNNITMKKRGVNKSRYFYGGGGGGARGD